MTLRKNMIELLACGQWSAREISGRMQIPEKEVVYHLEHIQKTLKNRFTIQPAVCLSCGFVFSKRTRIKSPGKCPICRNEHIQDPCFSAASDVNP